MNGIVTQYWSIIPGGIYQVLYNEFAVPYIVSLFRNYLQTDRHTHRRTDGSEMILIRNLLMVKHTVVIASVAACSTYCSRFDLLSISIDFNVKITVIFK